MRKDSLKEIFLKKLVLSIWLINLAGAISFCQFCPPVKDKGIFRFNLENDVWLKRDDGYTNGLQLGWISPQLDGGRRSGFLSFLGRLNNRILKDGVRKSDKVSAEKRYAAFSLYQGMFTPQNLSRPEVIPDDRPYAGLLAVYVHLVMVSPTSQKVFGLTAGLVGPHSLAEKAQTWLHETFDWTRPMGWSNQLRDEPVFDLWYGRNWLFYHGSGEGHNFLYGGKAGLNAQLGNLLTSAGGFLELGLGWNFRPELEVFSPAPFSGDLSVGRVEKFSIFGFIRGEGRFVARNLLLQGNTFVSSPGVKINHLYGQVEAGLGYRNSFAAARFYLVVRSKEFQGQRYYDPYVGLTFDLNL